MYTYICILGVPVQGPCTPNGGYVGQFKIFLLGFCCLYGSEQDVTVISSLYIYVMQQQMT